MPRRPSLLLVVLVLVLSGCGLIRLDGATSAPREVPAAEQERQALAVRTAALVVWAARTAETTADLEVRAALDVVAADARAHLDALGGVWQPPGPARTAVAVRPVTDASAVLAELRTAAEDTAAGVVSADDGEATLLASVALARWVRADELAAALDLPASDLVLEGPEGTPELPERLEPEAAAALCRTLDAIGHATEVLAARSESERDALAERARLWRERAQAVAVAAGLDGTGADPREVSYAMPDGASTAVEDWTAELLPAWLAQVATTSGPDRERALEWALVSARAGGVASAFPGLD